MRAHRPAAWEITTSVTAGARRVARIDRRALAALARATLASEGAPAFALSLTLVDDDEIRTLNAAYLGRDRPTDVVTFEMPRAGSDASAPRVGDVYVSLARARAQAAERRRPLDDELRLLVVHGVLHALGYDDERAAPRRLMRSRERAALRAAAGVPALVRT